MLTNIKIIIWDFDGTFYPQNAAVTEAMEEGQYQTIMRIKGWDKARAKEEFWKVYPKVTTSGNAAVGIVCGIPTAQAAVENEVGFDRLAFIQKDSRLASMFSQLKQYRHFVLGNGVQANLVRTIKGLGIAGVFEEIVTSETVGENKPDPAGYLYIMKKTGLPAEAHLMVGDREVVDLAPAKKLGMQTCLVTWGGESFTELAKPGTSVDITIPTVYDLPNILG